jgi:hypothetical protein
VGNYSKNPQTALKEAVQKGYVRVRFQQGKPVLDRELNLAADLVAPNSVLRHYVGDGVPEGTEGFAIGNPDPQAHDFTIKAGRCVVNGLEVVLNSDTTYKNQPHKENVRPFPQGMSLIYLRVFTVEVNETQDPDLKNANDIGFETALRERVDWEVLLTSSEPGSPDYFLIGILVYSGDGLPPPPESEVADSILKVFAGRPAEIARAEKMLAERAAARELAEKKAADEKALAEKSGDEKTIIPVPEEPTADVFDFRLTELTLSKVRADLNILMNPEHTRLAENLVLLRNLSITVVHESSVTINASQSSTVKIANGATVGISPWFLVSVWGTGSFTWAERSTNNDRILFITNLLNNAQAVVNVKALKINF